MNKEPLALVTGIGGFVGAAVAIALRRSGYAVRGLVRGEDPRSRLGDPDIEIIRGDMRDAETMTRALSGVRYLFHVAADYRLWVPKPDEIVRNNVEGTRTVMDAALRSGVERVIYTSSVATLLPDPAGPADETRRASESQVTGAYKRSKVLSERLVERMVREHGLPAVIVSPSTPIGPRDARPTPTGRIIVEAASGRMPAYVDSGLNLVHVDDVASGHLLAAAKGEIGRSYVLGGQDVLLADLLREIARLVGRRPPALRLPRAPLYPLAWANEMMALASGREPFLTRDGLRMAKHRMFFSSARAERELGYRARPWPLAVSDAIDWFRSSGAVR